MTYRTWVPPLMIAAALAAASCTGMVGAGAPQALPTIVEPTVRPVNAEPQSPPAQPTSDAQPVEPAQAPPPAPTAIPHLASSVFRDDFNGSLNSGWSWYQSDTPGSSLTHTPGWLRLNLSQGSFLSDTPPQNLLVRAAPAGDFDMSTWLRFNPYNNFELAGLVVVFDDHSVLQFGRGGCFFEAPAPGCLGDGLYFDNIQNGAPIGGNFATQSFLGLDYVLRLQRLGNSYAASYSNDAMNWTPLGSHTVDRTPVSIGLIAAQATVGNPHADFDYFELAQQ
jgi:beta-xylosidase